MDTRSLSDAHLASLTMLLRHVMPELRLRTSRRDGAVLPGTLMQWMFRYPEAWYRDERRPSPPYLLSESYRLSAESYRFISPDDVRGGELYGHVCWADIALHGLLPHQRPPVSRGFWDFLHLKMHGVDGVTVERLQRMIGGAVAYAESRGWKKEAAVLRTHARSRGAFVT